MYITDSKNEKKNNYLNRIELYVMCHPGISAYSFRFFNCLFFIVNYMVMYHFNWKKQTFNCMYHSKITHNVMLNKDFQSNLLWTNKQVIVAEYIYDIFFSKSCKQFYRVAKQNSRINNILYDLFIILLHQKSWYFMN